jgi:hypothetical protein
VNSSKLSAFVNRIEDWEAHNVGHRFQKNWMEIAKNSESLESHNPAVPQ